MLCLSFHFIFAPHSSGLSWDYFFSRTKECFHYSLICQLITIYAILSLMWQNTSLQYNGDNCIVFENFMSSIVDLMVANIRLLVPLTRRKYTQLAVIFKYNATNIS